MSDTFLLLGTGLLGCALIAMCGRGVRPPGISFFEVVHDSNRASRRAKR